MADPTPEPEYWLDDEYGEIFTEGPEGPVSLDDSFVVSELNSIPDKIRAAVGVERERAWEAVLALSTKDMNEYEKETASADDYAKNITRHVAFMEAIAAIRAEPADEGSETLFSKKSEGRI